MNMLFWWLFFLRVKIMCYTIITLLILLFVLFVLPVLRTGVLIFYEIRA